MRYGIVSAKIPCVKGRWYGKTLPVVSVVELSACGSHEPPNPADKLPLSAGVFVFGVALAAAARRFEGKNIKKNKKNSKKCVKTLDRFSRKCYNIGVERMEVLRNERLQGIGKQQRKSD